MVIRVHPHHGYPLLIFSWAALSFGVAQLLEVGTLVAQQVVAIAVGLAGITTVVGLVHLWRYG